MHYDPANTGNEGDDALREDGEVAGFLFDRLYQLSPKAKPALAAFREHLLARLFIELAPVACSAPLNQADINVGAGPKGTGSIQADALTTEPLPSLGTAVKQPTWNQ